MWMCMLLPRLIGLLAMIPALTAPTLAAPAFQEGEWEITIRTEIPGVPFTPPPVTMQGVSHTTTSGESGSMRITSRMAGRRIGPCR